MSKYAKADLKMARPLATFGILYGNDVTYRCTLESVLNTDWPGPRLNIDAPPNTLPTDRIASDIGELSAGAVVMPPSPFGLLTPAACRFLAKWALAVDAEFCILTASDIAWRPDSIKRLIGHNKDVVAGWSRSRVYPHTIHVADAYDEVEKVWHIVGKPGTGLQRVAAFGGAMWCIKTDVFRKVPEPWWDWEMCPNGKIHSEDYFMCKKFSDHGYEIWVDWDECNLHQSSGVLIGRDGPTGGQ